MNLKYETPPPSLRFFPFPFDKNILRAQSFSFTSLMVNLLQDHKESFQMERV